MCSSRSNPTTQQKNVSRSNSESTLNNLAKDNMKDSTGRLSTDSTSQVKRLETGNADCASQHPRLDEHTSSAGAANASSSRQTSPRLKGASFHQISSRLPSLDAEPYDHVEKLGSPRRSVMKRPSADSIRSNVSSTSSVFSTASKISRIPHVMKSSLVSMKGFVSKSSRSRFSSKAQNRLTTMHTHAEQQSTHANFAKTVHYSNPGMSPFVGHESFSSRLRRRTPSAMGLAGIFSSSSRRETVHDARTAGISPSASTSYSVLEMKDGQSNNNNKSAHRSQANVADGRRNSVVNAATRLWRRDDTKHQKVSRVTRINENDEQKHSLELNNDIGSTMQSESGDTKAVGKLLFGVDIGNMEFFDQEYAKSATSSTISTVMMDGAEQDCALSSSDAKSDHITLKSTTHETVWGRQRAKSCQVRYNVEG